MRQRFLERVQVAPWEQLNDLLGDAALFVNTTTLGMAGQPELESRYWAVPSHAIVAELVYVPLVTPLVKMAEAPGLRTADGLGMLLHQRSAVLSCGSAENPKLRRNCGRWSRVISALPPASATE